MINTLLENKSSFAMKIGMVSQSLNMYLSGRRNITNKVLKRIKDAFPQVNIDWLKTGKGEPLINSMVSEFSVNQNKEGGSVIDREKELLKAELKLKDERIKLLEEALARRSWELITKSGRISNAAKKNNRNNNDK